MGIKEIETSVAIKILQMNNHNKKMMEVKVQLITRTSKLNKIDEVRSNPKDQRE
jgi:hypothetical protein